MHNNYRESKCQNNLARLVSYVPPNRADLEEYLVLASETNCNKLGVTSLIRSLANQVRKNFLYQNLSGKQTLVQAADFTR